MLYNKSNVMVVGILLTLNDLDVECNGDEAMSLRWEWSAPGKNQFDVWKYSRPNRVENQPIQGCKPLAQLVQAKGLDRDGGIEHCSLQPIAFLHFVLHSTFKSR